MKENELSKMIIGRAIEVHKQLGPGLSESAYQKCMYYELRQIGLKVHKEKPFTNALALSTISIIPCCRFINLFASQF